MTTLIDAQKVWEPQMSGSELARQLNVPDRTGRDWAKKLRAGGNGNGKVPARPAATKRQVSARPAATKRHRDPIAIGSTIMVLAVAAAVSYSHIVHLALLAGAGWWAWVLPLSLDGMVTASARCLVVDRRRRRPRGHPVAWMGLVFGLAGSLAANIMAVRPDLIDLNQAIMVMAAVPPVAVLISAWLLDRSLTE